MNLLWKRAAFILPSHQCVLLRRFCGFRTKLAPFHIDQRQQDQYAQPCASGVPTQNNRVDQVLA